MSPTGVRKGVEDLPVSMDEKNENEKIESIVGFEEMEKMRPQVFGGLPPEALRYIEKLQSELCSVEEVRCCSVVS